MAIDTHRLIYKHREKESYRKMQKGERNTTCIEEQTLIEIVGKRMGSAVLSHTHKRMFRATGRKEKKRRRRSYTFIPHRDV